MRRDVLLITAALVALGLSWGSHPSGLVVSLLAVLLIASVMAAVRHAEAIAHRIGEPFGTLVLAVCVTLIEVGLIVSIMAGGKADVETLARDTVFAAVMITTNGIVGLSLVLGAWRQKIVSFSRNATSGLLATLVALAGLTLVLPSFTESTHAQTFTNGQLIFASVCALVLYGVFVLVQTVIDRSTYRARSDDGTDSSDGYEAPPGPDPAHRGDSAPMWQHVVLLLGCLVAVVGLAKTCSYAIEDLVEFFGATNALVGVILAAIVLLPETLAAGRAGRRGHLQTSINLGLGSGIASIGLTVPAVALATVWLDSRLVLGLDPKELVLLVLTMVLAGITLSRGRATIINGTIHLVVLAVYVFLTIQP